MKTIFSIIVVVALIYGGVVLLLNSSPSNNYPVRANNMPTNSTFCNVGAPSSCK